MLLQKQAPMTGIKKFKQDREEALRQQEKQRQERRCLANPSLTLREVHLSCLLCRALASDHCSESPLAASGLHRFRWPDAQPCEDCPGSLSLQVCCR